MAWPRLPQVLLWAVTLASLGARCYRLADPGPAKDGSGGYIFDEKYYVNAARVLLHLKVPCPGGSCDPYASIAPGTDGNSEHPPLGKLLIAAGMKAFGDNAVGWRVMPVIFGTLAVLAMYWMVRSAGAGEWMSLGAASLLAADNLFLIHGRIATLDIFVLVFMLGAVALYLRGRPFLAGVALGVGACVKLVAPFVIILLVIFELTRASTRRAWHAERRWKALQSRLLPLVVCGAVGAVVYLGLLDALDIAVHPYHNPADAGCPGNYSTFPNSFAHTRFMLCYAGKLTAPHGPTGIASYPWDWLLNRLNINYFTLSTTVTVGSDTVVRPQIQFQGVMNPAIILLALPAFGMAAAAVWRSGDDVSALAVAWCLGTYLPLVAESLFGQRTSYLYYMLVVLPGICLAVALMLGRRSVPAGARYGYVAILGYQFVALYPFRTWTW